MADDDDDRFPRKSPKARKGRSAVSGRNEESFTATHVAEVLLKLEIPLLGLAGIVNQEPQVHPAAEVQLHGELIGIKEHPTCFSIHYICLYQTGFISRFN